LQDWVGAYIGDQKSQIERFCASGLGSSAAPAAHVEERFDLRFLIADVAPTQSCKTLPSGEMTMVCGAP